MLWREPPEYGPLVVREGFEKLSRVGEDAGQLAGILRVVDGGAGEDPEVRVELVVGLGAALEIEAVADRLVADVPLQQHALRRMQHDPPGHGFIDRRILDEGVCRNLAGHVEMDGVVAHLAGLAQLRELDPLDLDRLETLAEDHMGAEAVAGEALGEIPDALTC